MEEDALMDGRTDGRGCGRGRHRKTISRYAEYFFCLSARQREAGLEKKPLSPTLLSAVLRGDTQTTSKLHYQGGLNQRKTNWWDVVWTLHCKSMPNASGEEG